MKRVEALVLLSTLTSSILAADLPRPRGVGPEFAKHYKNPETFACITNPSIQLSPSQVNDDFCDCPDGSDEPGTAACTYLSSLSSDSPIFAVPNVNTTLALPGYYCKNKGHIPAYVSHAYVNDGVCDYTVCCDGSDEWAHVGGKKCEDRCKEIGKEWRKQDDIKQKGMRNALRKKDELLATAQSMRTGIDSTIKALEIEVRELVVKEKEAKKRLDEVERSERGKISGSKGKGSRTTVLADLARRRVEELRGTVLGLVGKRDELRDRIKDLEAILKKFSEEYNPNFNDEGVKRAVKAWQDYAANTGELKEDRAEDLNIDEVAKEDSNQDGGINWSEWETEEASELDEIYQFEAYLPVPVRSWIRSKITDLRILLIENGILADNTSSEGGAESKAVTDARSTHSSLETALQNKQGEITEQRGDLDKDYGPSGIFRALRDTCIEKDSGEYTYELCFLKSTTQKSKKGHGNTGMGNFVKFDKITVDEEVGSDGKGLGSGERLVLKYENGQHCWNGPNRETTVILACAEESEIWKIAETEKCLYRMEVGTPAVCEKVGSAAKKEDRDEL